MWQLVFASRHRLIPQQEEEQEQEEDAKRVSDGPGRSFRSGPWQKKHFFIKKKYIYSLEKLDKVVNLVGGGSVINGAYTV